tara:strand:- start:848 stop:1054 length:207 start_codon:yes stop_codon:yes gene_type:complete
MTQTQNTEETKPVKKRRAKHFHTGKGTAQEIQMICNFLNQINFTNQAVLQEQVENCKTKLQEIKEGKK